MKPSRAAVTPATTKTSSALGRSPLTIMMTNRGINPMRSRERRFGMVKVIARGLFARKSGPAQQLEAAAEDLHAAGAGQGRGRVAVVAGGHQVAPLRHVADVPSLGVAVGAGGRPEAGEHAEDDPQGLAPPHGGAGIEAVLGGIDVHQAEV